MSYLGVKTQGEVLRKLSHYAEHREGEVRTVLGTDSRIGLVLENTRRLQTGRKEGVFCLADGRSSSGCTQLEETRDPRQSYPETVAKAWKKEGAGFLNTRDITASLVIWDASSNQLILARAQNGVPPIFFTEQRDTLLWSNSIKTLLRYGVEASLDRRALDAYLALGYVPSPWTFFRGVRKVPAGQFLEWSQGSWTFRRHRNPVSQSRSVHDTEAKAAELKRLLCESLDQVVNDHDRVGVLLSGGVDSSLLVGLLHCELGTQVEAFTFNYSDYEGKYNEYDQARRLTDQYDIPHHRICYSGEWLEANLEEAVRKYEEPFSYGHHTARLKEAAQSDIRLLLNGMKGGLYISRTANYALRIESSIAERAAKWVKSFIKSRPFGKPSRLRHALDIVESSASELFYRVPGDRILSGSIRRQLYVDPKRASEGETAMLSLFEKEARQSGLTGKADRLSHLHNHFSVQDHFLWWNYRWTRSHGLEMEAPFLMPGPRRFMEQLRQPLWPPYHESIRKVMLRRVAATVMPNEIAYNQKIAQTAPFWRWFRGPLRRPLREYLHPSKLREEGLFEVDFVQGELQKHLAGNGRRPYLIWTLLCFMVWKEEFIESGDFS